METLENANCEKFNCWNDKILWNVELESEHICNTFTGLTSNNVTSQTLRHNLTIIQFNRKNVNKLLPLIK